MMAEDRQKYNSSGYKDLTAYSAIKAVSKREQQVHQYIKIIKALADKVDFEIVGRVEIKDKTTGRVWR